MRIDWWKWSQLWNQKTVPLYDCFFFKRLTNFSWPLKWWGVAGLSSQWEQYRWFPRRPSSETPGSAVYLDWRSDRQHLPHLSAFLMWAHCLSLPILSSHSSSCRLLQFNRTSLFPVFNKEPFFIASTTIWQLILCVQLIIAITSELKNVFKLLHYKLNESTKLQHQQF